MKRHSLLKYLIAAAMRREPDYDCVMVFMRRCTADRDPVDELMLEMRAARSGHSEAAAKRIPCLCHHYRTWWRACARALTQLRNLDTDLLPSS